MDLHLKGKTAIVTGGSRGIGKASARELACEGVDVAIVARDMATLDASAKELAKESGRRVVPISCDTTNDDAVKAMVKEVAGAFGHIDILVNSGAKPGGHFRGIKLADITEDKLHVEMGDKVMGYLRCAREVVCNAVRAEREKAIARRKDALTGTSDYPNLGEKQPAVLNVAKVATPKEASAAVTVEPLPRIRLAEPYEALRDKSDQMLAKTGARPKVFLANLGKLSDFTARAMFAKNFYEAGGIEAIGNDDFKDRAEMITAFKTSGARLACLCASDAVYAEQAAEAAKALTAAGAIVHLAGRPGENEESWRQAGIKTFVFIGCDVLSTLRAAYDSLAQS